jgi:hypothetical protein
MRSVEKENPLAHVAAARRITGYGAQGDRTIQATEYARTAVSAERSRPDTRERPAVRAEQDPCSLHRPV